LSELTCLGAGARPERYTSRLRIPCSGLSSPRRLHGAVSSGKLGDLHHAAKLVRGLADKGDALCKEIFRVQAHALGLFFDEMVNTFDPDALIVGGGALETSPEFQRWFIEEIRAGMPTQREEQADIPIYLMPNGDSAGARGAAIEALKLVKD
jgi:glucokinase